MFISTDIYLLVNDFINSIVNAKKNLKYCSRCYNISDTDPCTICSNPKRDENTIFVGCDDATIKMVNINTNEILHVLYGHKQRVCCLKIIEHEHFGKCIISKGWGGDFIKLLKKKMIFQ